MAWGLLNRGQTRVQKAHVSRKKLVLQLYLKSTALTTASLQSELHSEWRHWGHRLGRRQVEIKVKKTHTAKRSSVSHNNSLLLSQKVIKVVRVSNNKICFCHNKNQSWNSHYFRHFYWTSIYYIRYQSNSMLERKRITATENQSSEFSDSQRASSLADCRFDSRPRSEISGLTILKKQVFGPRWRHCTRHGFTFSRDGRDNKLFYRPKETTYVSKDWTCAYKQTKQTH